MTPYEAYQLDQERIDQQEEINFERRIDGNTDAAFGYLPKYNDEAYLLGYCEGAKELKTDSDGKILYYQQLNNQIAQQVNQEMQKIKPYYTTEVTATVEISVTYKIAAADIEEAKKLGIEYFNSEIDISCDSLAIVKHKIKEISAKAE